MIQDTKRDDLAGIATRDVRRNDQRPFVQKYRSRWMWRLPEFAVELWMKDTIGNPEQVRIYSEITRQIPPSAERKARNIGARVHRTAPNRR